MRATTPPTPSRERDGARPTSNGRAPTAPPLQVSPPAAEEPEADHRLARRFAVPVARGLLIPARENPPTPRDPVGEPARRPVGPVPEPKRDWDRLRTGDRRPWLESRSPAVSGRPRCLLPRGDPPPDRPARIAARPSAGLVVRTVGRLCRRSDLSPGPPARSYGLRSPPGRHPSRRPRGWYSVLARSRWRRVPRRERDRHIAGQLLPARRDRAPRHESGRGSVSRLFRRRPTLPGGIPPSTIGAGGLNFRVRDGNGCDSAAMATGNRAQLRRCLREQSGACLLERSIASTSEIVPKPSAD